MNRLLPLPPITILAAQKIVSGTPLQKQWNRTPIDPLLGPLGTDGTSVRYKYIDAISTSMSQLWKVLSPGMSSPSLQWLPLGVRNGYAAIGPAWAEFASNAKYNGSAGSLKSTGFVQNVVTFPKLVAEVADLLVAVIRNPSDEEASDLALFGSLSGSKIDNTSSWSSPLSLGKFMLEDPYAALDRQSLPWGLDIAGVDIFVTWSSGGLVNGSIRDFWYSLRNFSAVIARYPWPNPKFYFECAFRAVIGSDTIRLFVVTSALFDQESLYDWITIEIMQHFKAMVSQVNDYVEDKQKRDAMSSLITKIFITAVTLGIGALAASAAAQASTAALDAGSTAAEAAAAGSAITSVTGKITLVTGLVGKKAAADAATGMKDLAENMHEENPEFAAQVTKTAWRINPDGMQAKADQAANESSGGTVDSVVKTVTENPVASAVGIGAVILIGILAFTGKK